MNDDNIDRIFDGFDPTLTDDGIFMSQLERNINTIETVNERNRMLARRNRLALLAASLIGFITGITFMVALPSICHLSAIVMQDITVSTTTIALVSGSIIATVSALFSYDIAQALFQAKKIAG